MSFRIGVYPTHDRMDLKRLQKQNQLHYLIQIQSLSSEIISHDKFKSEVFETMMIEKNSLF